MRFLAIIQLKNGVDRYWRHAGARNSIKPEERAFIRPRLLQGSLEEEDKSLVLHNALVVAKIFRIDYPQEWPTAFDEVTGAVRAYQESDAIRLNGALEILLRVIKELGTARLRRSQTALQVAAPELVRLLGEIYTRKTALWLAWLSTGRGDEDEADMAMQSSLTALKTLRRLLVMGYDYPHHDKLVQEFWNLSQAQFGQFMGFISHDSHVPAPYQTDVGKHLIQFTKLHIAMAEDHAPSFCLLPGSVDLVLSYWRLVVEFAEVFDKSGGIKSSTDRGSSKTKLEGPLLERLALKGLLLLKECIAIVHRPSQSFKYQSQEAKKEKAEAIEILKAGLLTDVFVLEAVSVIVNKLFIFRQSDLEAWEEDPEEWEAKERDQGDAWEWEIRPCSERIFLDLLMHYKQLLGPPLLSYFELGAVRSLEIVRREAVYTAMGCAAAHIYEAFNFNTILESSLWPDLKEQGQWAKLLLRRIPILISQWVPVGIAEDHLAVVYQIFADLMAPEGNDEVVRITAARQLKPVGDDFKFDIAKFAPFGERIFGYLVDLVRQVSIDETKLAILDTIRVLVTRLESSMALYGDTIMSIMPEMWAESGEEDYMLKQSILSIVTALVFSMKTRSQAYVGFVLPLLAEAMNSESALHLHLIEESVELWKTLLEQLPAPLPDDLLALVQSALPLLEYDSEVSNQCLQVVKNYVVMAPEAMLKEPIRAETVAALAKTLESRSRDQVKLGTMTLELLIRAAELIGGVHGLSVIVKDMVDIGLINNLLTQLHQAWEAGQTTGPNKKQSSLNTVTEADYFAILARIALADPATFVQQLVQSGSGGLQQNWAWLSAEWFANFDFMSAIDRQKLSLLALTRLMELPQPVQELVLGKLQDYLAMWTSVIAELQDGEPKYGDALIWEPVAETSPFDTPLDVREREFAVKDPVHAVHAYSFVRERLQDLVQRCGGEQAFEANWAVNVDRDVLVGFQKLGEPRPAQDGN
jgi:hypothetical protein